MRRTKSVYSEAFKRQVVEEILQGAGSAAEVTRKYGLSSGIVYRWCREREEKITPAEEDSRVLRARVAELERMVGRLAMENDFLKKFAAYTKQQTNAHSSVITAKTLAASRRPAGWLGLPAARTTTRPEGGPSANGKTPSSKSD